VSKSDTPNGLSLPELKEVAQRLRCKEPELEAIIRWGGGKRKSAREIYKEDKERQCPRHQMKVLDPCHEIDVDSKAKGQSAGWGVRPKRRSPTSAHE
jgi:hypothetical protein